MSCYVCRVIFGERLSVRVIASAADDDFSEELKNSLMMVEGPKHVGCFLRNFK